MSREKIIISKGLLIKLYINKRLSSYKIGDLLNCSFSTVSNRLKEYKILLRTKAQAQMKYFKKDFQGNDTDKAYLIGFRLGDLNVYIPSNKESETIVARCHTTDIAQEKLIKQLFCRYGQVTISKSDYGSHVNCYLNYSFLFLLSDCDEIEEWIKNDKECSKAFAAGYIDAEGSFTINQRKARFKIDSYDKNILNWLHKWLISNSINSKLKLIAKKDDHRGKGIFFHNDLWRININEAYSILKFIDLIIPYQKHSKRRKSILLMKRNILGRKERGTI